MCEQLNVWALEKDIPLKVLLIEWLHRYGEYSLLLDRQEQNFQAIEVISISNPNLRAYLYTFAQKPNHYGIDLKYPTPEHNIIGAYESQSLEQTLAILETHLF